MAFPDPDVRVLTKEVFDDFVNSNEYVLAEFYAPWCGHCKELAPEYAKAATTLHARDSKVKLAKIDGTVEAELATRFGVTGYPSLFWFVGGQKRLYTGGRAEEDILAWISRKTTSKAYTVGSKIPEPADKPLVVLHAKKLDEDFVRVADELEDTVAFHFVRDGDLENARLTMQHRGESVIEAATDFEMENLEAFIQAHMLPVFGPVDGMTHRKYMASGKGLIWVILSDEEMIESVRPTVSELGSAELSEFKFAHSDMDGFRNTFNSDYGVTELPAIVVQTAAADKKKYVLQGGVEADAVASFVSAVLAGNVSAVVKSAPLPETNDEPVRVVVGLTMEKEIFQPEKDVLFDVYAPWCGHCVTLAPELEKLAAKLIVSGLGDIITVAKMDGTANDSPIDSIQWTAFPSLFYIKAGSSTPIPFQAGRDVESMWNWILDNHSMSTQLSEQFAAARDIDVNVLTGDTFDEFVGAHKFVLAEFYAPWCGHCKALAPEYAKTAAALKARGSRVQLAKIDATVEEELAKQYGVSGYPSIFWLVNGEKRAYTGGRTMDEIVAWINRKTSSDAFTSGENVPEPPGNKPVVVLRGPKLLQSFANVADEMEGDALFHFVRDHDVTTAAVVTIQHLGEEVIEAADLKILKGFVEKNLLPKFGAISESTYKRYAGNGLVWLVLSDVVSVESVRINYTASSEQWGDDFKFGYSDAATFQSIVNSMFGVTRFPAVFVTKRMGDKERYVFQGDDALDTAKVALFLEEVVAGSARAVLKSEPVPVKNDGPVRVVVASTMEEEIFHPEKDVLFEVYAPWCGHCKKLAPELDLLARNLKSSGLSEYLTIAKMDGTANDSPIDSISWRAYPSLFYIKAGTSEVLSFEGGRTADSMWKWIAANHSNKEELSGKFEAPTDPNVPALTESNFDRFVNSHKYVLAEFYAPWCGHCKKLAPEYSKAAAALIAGGSKVQLVKIDATAEEDLVKRIGVSGYPSLFWFVQGEKRAYNGGRTVGKILHWINRKTTSDPFTSGKIVPVPGSKPVVILEAPQVSDEFVKVADEMEEDFSFHFVKTDEGADRLTIQHVSEDAVEATVSELRNLKRFLQTHALPSFGPVDSATYKKYGTSGKGLVWLILNNELAEDIRPAFSELAAELKGFKIGYSDLATFEQTVNSAFGVTELPAVVVSKRLHDKEKYVLQGVDVTDPATVSSFVENVLGGIVPAVLKSEPVPSSNDDPIKVVVGTTMESELFLAETDVLFEVYAPWCGHCKKLAPELEKLARKIRASGLEDIVRIAKMDGTANDSPIESVSWKGYPTLFYVKAGAAVPLPFEGGRDVESMWNWIMENRSKLTELESNTDKDEL